MNDARGMLKGEELDILKIVADNPSLSQRKISEQTGLSLGQVNFLIKKCAKKGLIKIEGQTSKSIQYNITPKGIAEKAERTMDYIKISASAVLKLTDRMREIEKEYIDAGKRIHVVGNDSELMQIARLALKPESFELKTEDAGEKVIEINVSEFL